MKIKLYRGRGSGVGVPQRMGFVFGFREGKVAPLEWSRDPEALLSALISDESG